MELLIALLLKIPTKFSSKIRQLSQGQQEKPFWKSKVGKIEQILEQRDDYKARLQQPFQIKIDFKLRPNIPTIKIVIGLCFKCHLPLSCLCVADLGR